MKTYPCLMAQLVLAFSALVASGQGTLFIYDQQSATNQGPAGGDGGAPIQQEQPMGQSFTPALSSVGFVELKFGDFHIGNGVGATVYVNLLADSISGTVLGSTTPVFMPDGFFERATNFFFAPALPVTPGTTYYLQPVVLSGDDHWTVVGGNYGYSGGTFYAFGAPNSGGLDLWFREGVSVPEPSVGLLALFGIAGVLAASRIRRVRARHLAAVFIVLLATAGAASAQLGIGERVWSPPLTGNYWSMQRYPFPPMPFLPFDVPVYRLAGEANSYVFDDRNISYQEIEQAQRAAQGQSTYSASGNESGPPPLPGDDTGGGSGGGGTNSPSFGPDHGTNLWLEITNIVTDNVSILAHHTQVNYFQLLSKTNVAVDGGWQVEQEFPIGTAGDVGLDPVPEQGRSPLFFWAAQSDTLVSVSRVNDAIRPGPCYLGSNGYFVIERSCEGSSSLPELPVRYRISGTATNGVDYAYLSSMANIPESLTWVLVEVAPFASLFGSNLTVTLTLVGTNGYLVASNGPSATVLIEANVFSLVTSVTNPVGLDYHPPTQSLLVSVDPGTDPTYHTNFLRIATNGVVSHWADVPNLFCPVTMATVKTSTNGFFEGAMYFDGMHTPSIGWLSTNGTESDKDWVLLDGYASALGGLYVDQTGVWGGDLIATAGGDDSYNQGGIVWRITSSGTQTQVVDLASCLGGVITLANDVAQWGPWAGKIITGQAPEPEPFLEQPEIYAIDTNGQITTNCLGVQPEHFNLIPPNQPFYCGDSVANAVWKVPAAVFTNHVGQLLITGMGQVGHEVLPALFIVHWDAGITNFVVEKINAPDFVGCLEDGTFAPLDILPCLPH